MQLEPLDGRLVEATRRQQQLEGEMQKIMTDMHKKQAQKASLMGEIETWSKEIEAVSNKIEVRPL
jgi:predicted  nucleic acid-binding Zn-ribbon protein